MLTEIINTFRKILLERTAPARPDSIEDGSDAETVFLQLIAIRELLGNFAKGNFEETINIRGALAGSLKTLQANLKHLAWQVQQVAQGDFKQRVEFMGDFSHAFNTMVVQLEQTLSVLKDEIARREKTERHLRESEERWNLAVECSRDGIWDINLDTNKTWYSERLLEMLGFDHANVPPDFRWDMLIHPEDEEFVAKFRKMIAGKAPLEAFVFDSRFKRLDGSYIWGRVRGMPAHEGIDSMRRLIGVISDVTHQKQAEEALAYQAMHDNLTGLPNRYLLDDRLKVHVANALRGEEAFVFGVLDLDDFKNVNDTLGHANGDKLLVAVAERIRKCLRTTDTVARLGGDEFVFVYGCPVGGEREATLQVMDRLYRLFAEPLELENTIYTIRTSAGLAFFPKHAEDVKKLFALADEALYKAKGSGKNSYAVWEPPK